MATKYRCPGRTVFGYRGNLRTVHDGCCAAFLLMSKERQERVGVPVRVPDPIMSLDEPDDEPITVGELIEVVRLLQLADEDGVAAPVSRVQYVLIEPDFPAEQLQALLDLGEPYGLQVHQVRPTRSPA